jgi:hypothetical protein
MQRIVLNGIVGSNDPAPPGGADAPDAPSNGGDGGGSKDIKWIIKLLETLFHMDLDGDGKIGDEPADGAGGDGGGDGPSSAGDGAGGGGSNAPGPAPAGPSAGGPPKTNCTTDGGDGDNSAKKKDDGDGAKAPHGSEGKAPSGGAGPGDGGADGKAPAAGSGGGGKAPSGGGDGGKAPSAGDGGSNTPADGGKAPASSDTPADGKAPAGGGAPGNDGTPAGNGKAPADDGGDGKAPTADGKAPETPADGKTPADDGKNPAEPGKDDPAEIPDNGKKGDGKANPDHYDHRAGMTKTGEKVYQDYNGDYYYYKEGEAHVIDKKDVVPNSEVPDNGKPGDGKANHDSSDKTVGHTSDGRPVRQDYNGDYYYFHDGEYTVVDKKDVVPIHAIPDNGKPGDGKANYQDSDLTIGQTNTGQKVRQDYNGDYYTYVDGVATVIDKQDVIPLDQVPDNGKGGDGKANAHDGDPAVGTCKYGTVFQDYNGDYYYNDEATGETIVIKKDEVKPKAS